MERTKSFARYGAPMVVAVLGLSGLPGQAADTLAPAAPTEATSRAVAKAAPKAPANGIYIVQLAERPLASDARTRPAPGRKIDARTPAARALAARLKARQDALMARAGVTDRVHQFTTVLNGFAARMTPQQAARLAALPGVLAVTPDELQQRVTASTPAFLGLTGPGGFYAITGAKGEDVVIGIVDSGIWPEHPSLDATGFGPAPAGWSGSCGVGEGFTAADCSTKLIGARHYNAGYGGDAATKSQFPYEYMSPRDADGHGTHTATTSGGNEDVSTGGSLPTALSSVSGIAPRARIAAYKVCWGRGGQGGCWPSDSVAAIEQAVLDGVDVINFSISGTRTNLLDPVEAAFRHAAAAGVFVAASAGNSGPALQTVAHPSPWITTVAAGTHDRLMIANVTRTVGDPLGGVSVASTAVGPVPVILAADAVATGVDPYYANLCYSSRDGVVALDPVKVAGKIVVCDRGDTARVNKSFAVQQAGGVGMLLLNTSSSDSLNADFHAVPSVHFPSGVRTTLRDYAATPGATASISEAYALTVDAPFTAGFSSRGPSLVTGRFDLLKPDIIAPGVDILAGVSPDGYGSLFGLLSGTSMSSPHVAGMAALFKELHPSWSPMAIKSALMTSAGDVLDGPNTDPQVIWRQGAGHTRPGAAVNPGLVFDSGSDDWDGLLCGQGLLQDPRCHLVTMDASDLNVPSIGIGDIPGSQTAKRRVTNVSGAAATFTASVTGLDGYAVSVQPSTLNLAAGATGEFAVTFTRSTAPVFGGLISDFRGGQLTWSGAGNTVRIPIVVTATAAAATVPSQITGGVYTMRLKMNIGYTGSFRATPRGLVPAQLDAGTASTGSSQTFPVVIPAGTTLARFALFDADVTPGSDIDIVVRNPGGAVVGTGFSGTSQEQVNLANPAAGTYTVEVQGYSVPSGSSPFKLHSWALGTASARNLSVRMPTQVTAGQQIDILLMPSRSLLRGQRYLGSVAYTGAAGLPAPTLVQIEP